MLSTLVLGRRRSNNGGDIGQVSDTGVAVNIKIGTHSKKQANIALRL